jgi:hypothetical protein
MIITDSAIQDYYDQLNNSFICKLLIDIDIDSHRKYISYISLRFGSGIVFPKNELREMARYNLKHEERY